MIKDLEDAIRGMKPQQRPDGLVHVRGASVYMALDAPDYGLYRDRDGALWVQITIGITGDDCWYGPIPKGDPRHAELLKTAQREPEVVKAVRTRAGRIIAGVVTLLAMLPAIATGLGFLGSLAWPLDLFTHFRVQYFVSLAIATVILVLLRWRKAALVFALCAIANLALILPLYAGRAAPSPGPSVRAMLMNVNTRMGDPKRVAEAIQQVDPDIVVLEEVSEKWVTDLADTMSRYPHSQIAPRDDNFGIALLSRLPLMQSQTVLIGSAGVPSIIADVQTPQGPCTVIATHPLPPMGGEYASYRNDQLAALATAARQVSSPLLVIGDLNCTPWSPHFARLLRDSGLQDSTRGWGVQPSWPADHWMLRIPIDHCLHSPSIKITRRQIGPDVASDHFPLIVEFRLP